MVVSDVPPAARGVPNFEGGLWVSVGEPVTNVGITAAERTRAPDGSGGTVSLTLVSNASAPVRRRLNVSARDQDVVVRDLDVPSGASSLTFAIPAGLPAVRVRLSDDALRRDDEVVLAEPRPRTVAVENRLPDGRGRSALLQALDALSGVTAAESGHLVFVDAGGDRSGWCRQTSGASASDARRPRGWPAAESKDYIGPFVAGEASSAAARRDASTAWCGQAPGRSLRTSSGRSSRPEIGCSWVCRSRPTRRTPTTILVNLDLDRTNLIRSPDWPILISNVIEMRRQSLPGPERWNYRTGEWVRARLDRDPTGPLSFRCGAVERALPASRQLEFIAPSPGGLLQILEGDRVLFELGVNFLDEEETRLARSGDRRYRRARIGARPARRERRGVGSAVLGAPRDRRNGAAGQLVSARARPRRAPARLGLEA